MKSRSQSSANFVAAFSELASRLAVMEICTHTVDIQWGHFGNWALIATKRDEAVRFRYDGRDSFLTVETSPIRDNSSPNEWEQVMIKGMDNMNNESMVFAEEFLRKRFAI